MERTQEESPAMKAGIQCGDIISKIDGNAIESMQSYYTYLQTKKAGRKGYSNGSSQKFRWNEYAEKGLQSSSYERDSDSGESW